MKINLTRLLEVPTRVYPVGERIENLTSAFTGMKREVTSADRAYSFVLSTELDE